jgi:hypothetical protein
MSGALGLVTGGQDLLGAEGMFCALCEEYISPGDEHCIFEWRDETGDHLAGLCGPCMEDAVFAAVVAAEAARVNEGREQLTRAVT